MTIFHALILGIVEGLTEFLPISSTGHMILTSSILRIPTTEFLKTFEIAIQIGAILAVLSLYFTKLIKTPHLWGKLIVAFIPTGIVGFLAYKTIKMYLFNPLTVSISLIIGGIILIWLDTWTEKKSTYASIEKISYIDALKIGAIQCISMIPGTSRAAATIFGGVFVGFDRKQAAEFSFLLAIPTMAAATGYDLLKSGVAFSHSEWNLLGIGFVTALISAIFAVRWFIAFLTKHGFKFFGYYRIVIGLLFLVAYQYFHLTW